MFFNKDDIIDSIELINEFIYIYNLFDFTRMIEIYNLNYESINFSICSALRYYYFNMIIPPIQNYKNNIFTL